MKVGTALVSLLLLIFVPLILGTISKADENEGARKLLESAFLCPAPSYDRETSDSTVTTLDRVSYMGDDKVFRLQTHRLTLYRNKTAPPSNSDFQITAEAEFNNLKSVTTNGVMLVFHCKEDRRCDIGPQKPDTLGAGEVVCSTRPVQCFRMKLVGQVGSRVDESDSFAVRACDADTAENIKLGIAIFVQQARQRKDAR